MTKRDKGREVMEAYLGRKLLPDEIVHHKDENRGNNEPSNLELTDRAGHVRIHNPAKGYKFTEEQRQRLSDSHIGYKHTEQAKQNMSNAQRGRNITWGHKISEAKFKVTKDQLLDFLKQKPHSTLKEVKVFFNLKTHMAILRLGGLKQLKREATL